MQQNARVIILTLDAARAAGLELARPLDALEAAAAASPSSSSSSSSSNAGLNGRARPTPSTERSAALSSVDDDSESESDDEDDGESERGGEGNDAPPSASSSSSLFDRPAGFTAIALPPPPPSLSGYRPMTPVERTRGVAATLLLSFLGARLNSAFSLGAFVETVAGEYRAGRAAAALLAPLTDEELASVGADAGLKVVAPTSKAAAGSPFGDGGGGGSGGGGGDDDAPETATAGSGAAAAGRALLSQWVSIAYMTMAQMGVPHALSKSPGAQGWAFAGGQPVDVGVGGDGRLLLFSSFFSFFLLFFFFLFCLSFSVIRGRGRGPGPRQARAIDAQAVRRGEGAPPGRALGDPRGAPARGTGEGGGGLPLFFFFFFFFFFLSRRSRLLHARLGPEARLDLLGPRGLGDGGGAQQRDRGARRGQGRGVGPPRGRRRGRRGERERRGRLFFSGLSALFFLFGDGSSRGAVVKKREEGGSRERK